MAYNLAVQCFHRVNVFSVHPHMSTKEILQLIASHFSIPADSFELEVYDDQSQRYIDFDDEYAEELQQILPRTHKKTINAQVLFQETRKTDLVASFDDAPSPSYVSANSPSSKSASEDLRPDTPNIDLNLCVYDNSSDLSTRVQLPLGDNSEINSRLVFVRDVAPCQRTQYRRQNDEQDAKNIGSRKKNYIIRIQGVKIDSDAKYASILPEIKFPSIYSQQDQLALVIAIVIEERDEGQVTWRLDTTKGFLSDHAETDAIHCNPIQLSIDRSALSNDGIYKLPLRMCTVSQERVVKAESIFYRLTLNTVQQLHSAEYVPNTPRLACVMANQNDIIYWDTLGLSDFMRPKSYAKRKVEEFKSESTNDDQSTETQMIISDKSALTCSTSSHLTTSDLPNKHPRLMKEITIALFGLPRSEIHGSILETGLTGHRVVVFQQLESLIKFLCRDQDQQVVLILSNYVDEARMLLIHNSPKLHSIYVFSKYNDEIQEWSKKWKKISGIFNNINTICHELKQIITEKQDNTKPITITSVPSTNNFDMLSPLYIYQQLLKKILFQIQFNEKTKQDLFDLIREEHMTNDSPSQIADEFRRRYYSSSLDWWYTKESHLYSMLNKALRLQDIDIHINMRYFMRDIHNRYNRIQCLTTYNNHRLNNNYIAELARDIPSPLFVKSKQKETMSNKLVFETGSLYNLCQHIKRLDFKADEMIPITVYRGQGLSRSNFEQLLQKRGGLLSFNNFLSTSTSRNVSLLFAESAQSNPDLIGILFEIKLDKSLLSTSIISLPSLNDTDTYFNNEEEILLSMGTAFRIKNIERIDVRLWQVELTFSVDDDKIYKNLIRQDMQKTTKESTRVLRLGSLMINMGEFEKAEEIYKTLSETEYYKNWEEIAYLYNQLGCVNNEKGNFRSALLYYQKALAIRSNKLSQNSYELAKLFSDIGTVYKSTGYWSTGISYLLKTLDIYQKDVTLEYSDLAMTYNNIGQIYSSRREYTTSLLYFQKAIETQQRFSVSSYPFLAIIYVNISQVYYMMKDTSNALVFLEKALVIYQKKSSFISPELIEIYYLINLVKNSNKNYTTTLTSFPKVLQSQNMYLPLVYAQMINNGRLICTERMAGTESQYIYKTRLKRKFDSNHFVAAMAEIDCLNSFKDACRISEKKPKYTKDCVLDVLMVKFIDDMDVVYSNRMNVCTKQHKDQFKDYFQPPINWKLPTSFNDTHVFNLMNARIATNYKTPQTSSMCSFLRTRNSFNSSYVNSEPSKDFGQQLFTALRANPSFFKSYYFKGTCYRRATLKLDELEEYKTGKIIMTGSFVSTSKEKIVGKQFISMTNNEKQSVIWIFKMKNHRSSLCIDKLSAYSIEKEVLIVPYTFFRITKGTNASVHVNGKSDSMKVIQLEECELSSI